MKIKYKGRTFSSASSLSNAMQRDFKKSVEQKVRSAANASGLSVKNTAKGIEVSGDASRMDRFYDRLGR